jgi:hypothetical protein
MLREIDEPDEFIPDEEMYESEEFKDLKAQLLQLQPIRWASIKKYFQKFKYQKKKRDLLLELVEDSEVNIKDILGPTNEYVHFTDAIPEIKTFLAEIEVKEKLLGITSDKTDKEDSKGAAAGKKTAKDGSKEEEEDELVEEVAFDPEKFNPFDRQARRKEEEQEIIKPNQARKVLKVKK